MIFVPTYSVKVENGLKRIVPDSPAGYSLVDEFHPCPSVCPWDTYGRLHCTALKGKLNAAMIDSVWTTEHREIVNPIGSGPYGRVRLGDAMTPGVYRTYVPTEQLEKAKKVIAEAV